MRRALSLFVLIGAGMEALHGTATGQEITPDGSFAHWTRVPMKPASALDPVSQWSVENGVLVCSGKGNHEFLRYDRELKDFAYHVEWRFTRLEGEPRYNSGVYVRNSADGSEWYQAQIGAPGNGGFFFYDLTGPDGAKKRVSLKQQMPPVNPVRPPGAWNIYDIRAEGPHLTLTVNGTPASQFECPREKGYIGLEAEGYRIEFRNLRLKELR